MSTAYGGTTWVESMESWAPRLIVLGGTSWLVAAGINVLIHFVDVLSTPVLSQVFVSGAFLLASLGLIGLAPRVATAAPRLAKLCLGVAILTVLGMVLNTALSVVSLVLPSFNVLDAESTVLIAILAISGLLAMVVFLLYGASVLWTGAASRTVGLLLLAEALVMSFVIFGPTDALPRGVFLVGAEVTHGLIFLSTGSVLQTDSTTAEHRDAAPA